MKRGVYLVAGGGYHKIGMTSDLDERLRILRLTVPFEIELLAFGDVPFQDDLRTQEMKLHARFNTSRVRPRSEWFVLSAVDCGECIELLKNLKSLKWPPRKPTPTEESRRQWAKECLERLKPPVALGVAFSSSTS